MSTFLIDRTPVVDKVYTDIKKRIITGELKPGAKLAVRELCECYGVSDTPVKQAMNRLVTEKLMDALPHRGMRVRCITRADIREAFEIRRMIELYAIPYALERVREGDLLSALRKNLEENTRLIENLGTDTDCSDTANEEMAVSREFHKILVRCIGNRKIEETYDSTAGNQCVYYQQKKDKRKAALDSLEEHRSIFECLSAQDEQGLSAAIISHLEKRETDVSLAAEE